MTKINTPEDLVTDIINFINIDKFCFIIEATNNSFTSGLYVINGNTASYTNRTIEIFRKYIDFIQLFYKGKGIISIFSERGMPPQVKYFPHYNLELTTNDIFELIIHQEYSVEPSTEKSKLELQLSIKKEKIKNSLVYACYKNDTNRILELLPNIKQAQLDRKFKFVGTPLSCCAKNNNLMAFKAVSEAGAKLNKSTHIETAFSYSPDIVKYIHLNFRDQFDEQVKKKGFSIAGTTRDTDLLNMVLCSGVKINDSGKAFPSLHIFADNNNTEGLKFLLDNGADINTINTYKQTALDRALKADSKEAIELLTAYDCN